MDQDYTSNEQRLRHARVLVELRELHDATLLIADILDDDPEMLGALNLLARIKHMRGELSQAVTCWAQLLARSETSEHALTQLRAIMHVARDPERGGGEFLALGPFTLARKPAAQLALEDAFQLFLARKPEEARARCHDLATKSRSRDPQTYKLAVLAEAWLAELSGEFVEASQVLERLGNERGFETDTDRVLALERVYERIGTAEALEAAVNICLYVERTFHKISVLSRLASLYRRLDQPSRAADYEARYLAAFRKRMHRLTLRDVARVAALRYLPIPRLREIRYYGDELSDTASRRELALASCLLGDWAGARRLLEEGDEPLDRVYLADLASLEGDEQRAVDLFIEVLRTNPLEPRLLASLLDHEWRAESSTVLAHFSSPEVFLSTRKAIEDEIRVTPHRPTLWRQLAALERINGNERGARQADQRASALAEAMQRDLNPVGRVLAAAVYYFVVKAKGLIHEVWATRQLATPGRGGWLAAENILGNLTAEMKESVRNTFLAVREYARTKLPHLTADILDYNYGFKVTKEDEPSSGLSAGLPIALAFLSVFLQRPVSQDLAATGLLVTDAHDVLTIRGVGDIEFKVKAAYHRGLHTLILPSENRAELMANGIVPKQVTEEIVRFVSNFDEAVQLAFGPEIFVEGLALRRSTRPPSMPPGPSTPIPPLPPLPVDRNR